MRNWTQESSVKRINTLRAKTGTYTDRQTGKEKNSYMTVGYVLEKDGDEIIKIDAIPVDFNGWLYRGDLPSKQDQAPQQGGDFASEDIPFSNYELRTFA
jgi:hypothetical protein